MPSLTDSKLQKVIEKVEVLTGERGDKAKRALRFGEIAAVQEQLSRLLASAAELTTRITAAQAELTELQEDFDTLTGGLGTAAALNFDTDVTLAANSDALLPTQKAVKAYAGSLVTDLAEGPVSSIAGELVVFADTTGKLLARATSTGLLKAAAGVLGVAVLGTDYALPIRGDMLLQQETTDATPAELTTDGAAPDTDNCFVLPNDTAALLRIQIVAIQTGGVVGTVGDSSSWDVNVLLHRGASAATVAIIGSPDTTAAFASAGASAWDLNLAANTVLGGLDVSVTGEVDKTIAWVARISAIISPPV